METGSDYERFGANTEQAQYWDTAAAPIWVALQEKIDRRMVPVDDLLLERSALAPGHEVVDVGCGTGALLPALARRVAAGGSVLGVDISGPMLARAEERLRAASAPSVRLLLADAQTHAFESAAFDRIVSRFGVMFFSDPIAAFGNLRGALRPGGRLCFVCWAAVEDNPWFALPMAACNRRLGPVEPRPPHAPGPFAFSERAYVEGLLSAAGFGSIAIETSELQLPGAATAEDEAHFACEMGPAGRLLRERAPDDAAARAAICAEVADAFRPFETEHGVRAPATVFCVEATRP
jgi:SAM-dependent methyltransferase